MRPAAATLVVVCIAALCVAGCTTQSPAAEPATNMSIRITAAPQNYTPLMSSTPGISLSVNATGSEVSQATFTWNASYGEFLSWAAPDYTIHQLGTTVTNHGETLYWSFVNKTTTPAEPVIITVAARDPVSGDVLGTSQVTLAWDGDFAVTVLETR